MQPFLPCDHDDEIHDVPNVPEIGIWMQYESQRTNLQRALHAENK